MLPAIAAAALLLSGPAAASPAAAPSSPFASPSFAAAVAELNGSVTSSRASSVGAGLSALAWDLDRAHQDLLDVRRSLSFLAMRARSNPSADATLLLELQSALRRLRSLDSTLQWRASTLRSLSAQATRDESLVLPAQRVAGSARTLDAEARWMSLDATSAVMDFRAAGFSLEASEVDWGVRAVERRAQDLSFISGALLRKVGR